MKRQNSKKAAAQKKKLDRQLGRMWKSVQTKWRKDAVREQAERDRQTRKYFKEAEARARKLPKRDLSQINFQTQHWWTEHLKKRDGMTVDEEKAALIYEAMRRRREVQQAWLEGKFLFGDNGWQNFTGWVIQHLPLSWPELDRITSGGIIKSMHSPWFIPPRGYSTFPDNCSPEQCRRAAMQVLRLRNTAGDPAAAKRFVEHAQKFVDAGFLIVAVDNKTKQSVRYALQAVERLPRSFRKADLIEIATPHVPSDLPQTEIDTLEKKRKEGTLTHDDISAVWRKHGERQRKKELQEIQQRLASGKTLEEINREEETKQFIAAETGDGWHTLVSYKTGIMDKRKRKGQLIEAKAFNFVKICRELEQLDAGKISKSDFVSRLRLR